jgi:hypothetical protein
MEAKWLAWRYLSQDIYAFVLFCYSHFSVSFNIMTIDLRDTSQTTEF